MRYFPVNIDIRDKECVVIGGGNVALRKVLSLLKAGARVKVIAPSVTEDIDLLASEGKITLLKRRYREGDLEGAFIAFSATDNAVIGSTVSKEAKRRRILINVADEPSQCTFTIPSVLERGDLMITISTGGRCPALSKYMRLTLERELDEAYGDLLAILGDTRNRLLTEGIGYDKCKDLLNDLMSSEMLDLIRKGDYGAARTIAASAADEATRNKDFKKPKPAINK